MSNRSPFRLALLPVAAMAMALVVTHGMGAEAGSEAARLDAFTHADGANYFALTLTPGARAPAAGGHDIVVLFDTSASQTGDYRDQGLAALKSLLAKLAPDDQVQLVAVDVNAIGMTKSFVAAGSEEMSGALEKLEARVPLGATDMQGAVTAAVARFADAGSNARSVVYIGDGMSTANLVGTESFEQLVATLVENQIAVSSYAVGPRLDEQVLGALAANTGGQVLKASQVKSDSAGTELAAAAQGTVLWPESVTWPPDFTEVLPARTPPLRTDRESLVVGTYKGEGPFEVQMTVNTPQGPKPLKWTVAANPPKEANDYIARIVESARVDGGISLPLVGSAGLKEAERAIGAGLTRISQMAVEALSNGDLDNAERLAREALRQDPGDANAKVVVSAVQKRRAGEQGPGAPNVADLDLAGSGGGAAPKAAAARPGAMEAPGGFMHAVQSQRKRIEQMITANVQNTINQARGKMSDAPEAAIQDLKLQLENVRRAPELEPDARDQLVDQLQAAVRQAEQRQTEVEERRQQQHEALAAAKDRAMMTEDLLRRDQKMEQLMERFNYLMEEGRYRIAEETVALDAQELDPNSPVPVVATHHSRMVGYYHQAMVLRVARQKGVVDALHQTEKAHVPFADEPPIVYPEAEVWQQLTNRRREKYSSMDLATQGGAEQRIAAELKAPTELQFIETPLQDVMETLKDYHEIEIQIDQRALDDVGVPADTPITKDLKGISLRSALRLMLRELDLTYVIEDEVLLITTPEEAEMRLSTKVYPVADLVIPIMSGGMGGGMGMMGGM
ncbi:MAG: VWA domain-containing protein, partial [Planctomycetes bacterium]|nr:VWA domain-containing protein [Planctomycetota bacterium]